VKLAENGHCNRGQYEGLAELSRSMMLVGPTAAAVAANPPHFARGLGRAHVTNDPGFLPKQPPGLFAQARRRGTLSRRSPLRSAVRTRCPTLLRCMSAVRPNC
jgi:hypothetical protein